MSLNFLILKFLIPNRNIIPVFTPLRVSVKLEGDVVVAGLVRLIICKLASVNVIVTTNKLCTCYLAWERAKPLQMAV